MTPLSLIESLFLGAGAGLLYGLSFLGHTTFISKISTNFLPGKKFLFLSLSAFLRLLLLGLLWIYILRTPSLNIILVLISFFAGFWLVILGKKVRSHER